MAKGFDFVVVGGGLAGATAVKTLRLEGAEGSILLLAAEPHLPYHRPPLSKSALTAEQALPAKAVLSQGRYDELGIELLLATPVTAVDPTRRAVHTSDQSFHYERLLIATGASPRRLPLPGATLPGVFYLRSLDDAEAIRARAQKAKRAVVIGGSFIGLETAASLRQKGIEVTLLERRDLLARLDMPKISSFFRECFDQHGVEVIVGDAPAAIQGKTAVKAVATENGRVIPCDMVVIGAGVAAETGFLAGSGIAVDNGIVVDRFMQSSQPGIFAAGDVANFFDPTFNCQRRVEHWDNAVRQGRVAARNMLGQRVPYDEVTYFYSELFDLSFNLLGRFDAGDEKIERGSLAEKSYAAFYLRDDVPRALFSFGRPTEETKVTELLIRHRVNLKTSKARLSDPDYTLCHIPNQTIYILQGGGAFGGFECGAIRALEEAGIHPDVVAGVSIGAFNGAIVAGNPGHAAEALTTFWNDLAVASPDLPDENLRRQLAGGQIALFGVPQFFRPRWFLPMFDPEQLPNRWFSLYDTTPALALLEKYVDFGKLRSSPTRLMVSAVDVQTGELAIFDSYVDDLTPAHILASGSLPPGFPWTTIDGRHYWDGGIISNSPLDAVLHRCGSAGKRVFIIDLFPGKRSTLPANLAEAMTRQNEIVFSERIRSDLRTRDLVHGFRQLVEEIFAELPAATAARLRHRPRFIEMMGLEAPPAITRIVRESNEDEPSSKGYDFSRQTIDQLIESGYRTALEALKRQKAKPAAKKLRRSTAPRRSAGLRGV